MILTSKALALVAGTSSYGWCLEDGVSDNGQWRCGMRQCLVVVASMLCLWVSAAGAEDIRSGDWVWNIDDPESYHAGTQNAAGQVLMQMCDPADGSCFYAVGFDTSCDEGDSYPALVNSDAGTASIELLCGGEVDGGSNVMLVKDFEQVDNIIREATRIGFALPMKGDEFKAVRFSLKGSVNAIEAMRKVAAMGTPDRKGVKPAKDTEVF